MKKISITAILLLAMISTGCSINHPVAKDYGQYLENNKGQSNFPELDLAASYSLSEKTSHHRYEFRAATVGYAHLWIVEFGEILRETMNSDDVQAAFGKLVEKEEGGDERYSISFDLENYEFRNHHAYVSLNILFSENGKSLLKKTYHAEGISQGGKMFWGGPFAMKNATQQSTKFALDDIISKFIEDINKVTGNNQI